MDRGRQRRRLLPRGRDRIRLLDRDVALPTTLHIAPGALDLLPTLTPPDPVVVIGSGIGPLLRDRVTSLLPRASIRSVRSASAEDADLIGEEGARAVVGIGGSGTIDVAKRAAAVAGARCVVVATTLSADGFASPVAVLRTATGRLSCGVPAPDAIAVDLDLVAHAPPRHVASGIADAVSNISAVADWRLAQTVMGEQVHEDAALLALDAAHAIVGSDAQGEAFLRLLAEGLIAGGAAMTIAGTTRPCSGACHTIAHALDRLTDGRLMHGEAVALGTLVASFLRADGSFEQVDGCFRARGVPRHPRDVGSSPGELARAVITAPTIRSDRRYTILEHLDMDPDETRRRIDDFCEAVDR